MRRECVFSRRLFFFLSNHNSEVTIMKPNHVGLFNSELHRQWKLDRALRMRVPLNESWRGCLGLAALLKNVEDTFYHGGKCLIDNRNVTWLALRDVPPGHFPGSAPMNARGVNYVNHTVATLRHGMPVIDFTADPRNAIDFKFMPFSSYLRQIGSKPWDQELVEATGDVLHSE